MTTKRTIRVLHSYNFTIWDPVLDELLAMFEAWRGKTAVPRALRELSARSGVSVDCLKGWFRIGGRRPPSSPWYKNVAAVQRAMGYEIRIERPDKLRTLAEIRRGERLVRWRGRVLQLRRAA